MFKRLIVLFLGIGILASCSERNKDQAIEASEIVDGFTLSSDKIKLQFDKRGTIDVFKQIVSL